MTSVESALKSSVQEIFRFKKVTFDLPSDANEQDTAFIQVTVADPKVRQGREYHRVSGVLRFYVQTDKMPIGLLMKRIQGADKELTKKFFFHSFEEQNGTIQNVVEKTIGFEFFYEQQYNPSVPLSGIDVEVRD